MATRGSAASTRSSQGLDCSRSNTVARLHEQLFGLPVAPFAEQPLGVLGLDLGCREHQPILPECRRGGAEALVRVVAEQRPEAEPVGTEGRRQKSRRHLLDPSREVPDELVPTESVGGGERLLPAELRRRGEPHLDALHCRLESPLMVALGVADHGFEGAGPDPVLLVRLVGLADIRCVRQPARLGDVTLDRGEEDRQGVRRPEPESVLGYLLDSRPRLVVAAEPQKHEGDLTQEPPFARPRTDLPGQHDPRLLDLDRLLAAVAPVEHVAEVVVGAERSLRQVVLQRDLERPLDQGIPLLPAADAGDDQAGGVQTLGEGLGQPEPLRGLECGVDACAAQPRSRP